MMMSKPNHQQHLKYQHKIVSPDNGTQKSFTFLPMLCSSSSLTQVKLSHRRCGSSSSAVSSSITDDPSSPKVGCMGQVKRNNKVVGFPSIIISLTSSTTSSSNSISGSTHHHAVKCHEANNYTSNNIVKYYKFKRFFSTKSPTSVIAATRTAKSGSQKGKIGRKNVGNVCKSKDNIQDYSCSVKNDDDKASLASLVDMDPPLPVVKKTLLQQEQGNNVGDNTGTLWKRRSGGAPLKTLQVQVIQQNLSLLPANTI